nr:hypothetical protein [Tanacetum cinerariifolium]
MAKVPCRPMRFENLYSWDLDKATWGGRFVAIGTIPVCCRHGTWFLSKKGSGGGRGVKEKNVNASNLDVVKDDVVPSVTVSYGNTQKDLHDDLVAMKVQSSLVDQTNAEKTCGGSYPPLPTQGTTPAGNTSGNGIDVVVPVESIRAISQMFVNNAYGFFLGKRAAYPIVANHNPDVDLLKEGVGNVSVWVKLHGVLVTAFGVDGLSDNATKLCTPLMLDSYNSDMCLQSWGISSYARVMIELWADAELKDTIVVAMPKTMVGFKPHKEYRPVPKKPTANSSDIKKKGLEPTHEVSNLNPFEVLNSVDNDVELECSGDYDSEDEVALVDNDMARSMALEKDLSQEIQAICDNLDIRVRCHKKK